MAEVLAKQPRPQGPAADDRHQRRRARRARHRRPDRAAAASSPRSPPRRSRRSTRFLPAAWSHGNPIDILGDADPDRYAKALEVAAKDPNSDGLLVILTPQAMTDPTATAEQLRPLRPGRGQAGPGELDGRGRRRGRRGDPQPGGHPDLPLPRHRRPRLPRDVAVGLQPPRPLRDPDPARRLRRRRGRARPRRGDRSPRSAAPGRTVLDRGRVEAAARRLRHPDRRDPRSPQTRTRPSRPPTRSATRSCSSSTPRRSRTRPTSAACSSTWPTPTRSAAPIARSRRRCASAPAPGTSRA